MDVREGFAAVFSEVHHSLHSQMAGNAQMTAHHIDKERIALGRPDGGEMTCDPDQQTNQP